MRSSHRGLYANHVRKTIRFGEQKLRTLIVSCEKVQSLDYVSMRTQQAETQLRSSKTSLHCSSTTLHYNIIQANCKEAARIKWPTHFICVNPYDHHTNNKTNEERSKNNTTFKSGNFNKPITREEVVSP